MEAWQKKGETMRTAPSQNTTCGRLLVYGTMIAVGIAALTYKTSSVVAPDPVYAKEIGTNVPQPFKYTINELSAYYSRIYKVDEKYARCIIFKESSYNPAAVGDGGKAVGLVQFHLPTWKRFRKMMGKPQTDTRFVAEDALDTFFWALSKGYDRHWSPVIKGVCKK